MYKDFESLFERFCIMTVDAHLSDKEVLNKLKDKTTKDLYSQLENWCIQNNTI